MLRAACDSGQGEALCDALHPRLRVWAHHGGTESGWEAAVGVLRGEGRGGIEPLSRYHFEAAAALLPRVEVASACRWVREAEVERRCDALWHVSREFGGSGSEEYLQLAADALDGLIHGVPTVPAAKAIGKFIDAAVVGDVIKRRKRAEIDVMGAALLDGCEVERAESLLEGLNNGEIQITSGGAAMLDREEKTGWLVGVAGGVRRHMTWEARSTWRDLLLCTRWAQDKEAAAQLGKQAEIHHQRVMRREDERVEVRDVELLESALRAVQGVPQEVRIRKSLLHVLPPRAVAVWSEVEDRAVRVQDAELVTWAKLLEGGQGYMNPFKALSQTSSSERASDAILENVRGIVENVLWGGSEDAGWAAGRFLSRYGMSEDEWRLLFAVGRGFGGSMRELAETSLALYGGSA